MSWYDNTSLDFSLLDEERRNNINRLATSTQHFYEKYIKSDNLTLLQNDLTEALATTEEYASDLAGKIFSYFTTYYTPQPVLPQPVPQVPQPVPQVSQPVPEINAYVQQPQVEHEPTTYNPQFFNPEVQQTNVTQMEVTAIVRDLRLEILQNCKNQQTQQQEIFSQQLQAANQEISSLKREIDKQSNVLKQLADSFNQLRIYVKELSDKPV
jgi:hypothetical protein